MSIKQMSKVFEDTSIKGNEKLLMLALADNANDTGVCFPSWEKLIQKTSMSRNSLAKWLTSLERKELIFRKQRSRKNGSKTSNKFLIYPHENKDILDEEDFIIFEDLYPTVPKGELEISDTQSTKTHTTTVPKGELPNYPKVPKGELLEPSLKNLTITLTITNKRLKKEIESKLHNSKSINLDAIVEWINYKNYKSIAPVTKVLNLMSKYNHEQQQQTVDTSIMNEYKGLFEPQQQKTKSFNSPTMQTLNTDANVWDMIDNQQKRENQGAING